MTAIHLYPTPPYDFERTARSARAYDVLSVWRDDTLTKALRVGDGLALVRVTDLGTVESPHLLAKVLVHDGPHIDLEPHLRHWLAVDVALAPFYHVAEKVDPLSQIVRGLHGLHMLRTQTIFEALAVTLIEQQISVSSAQKAERWLVHTLGDSMEHSGHLYWVFPDAHRIARLTIDDLVSLKITFIRMRRLIELAQAHSDGRLPLEDLRHAAQDDVYRSLTALNGVGHWTAAWTMIRALGSFLYVSSADVALRSAVNHFWLGLPGRAARQDTDAVFAALGDFAGLASVYTLMAWEQYRYPRST